MARSHSIAPFAGQPPASPALPHGGELDAARRLYPDAPQPWIDLSTGINPWPYPVEPVSREAWTRLPGADALARLLTAAAQCYGAPGPADVVAAPGTQALIQMLPRLRHPGRVVIQAPTYAEHARCWALAGHEVVLVDDPEAGLDSADICIIVNPNNPDGRRHDPTRLGRWAARLAARGGWLLVDEAFSDADPALSAAGFVGSPGLVILRSFGKFYGLAGVRLGFVLTDAGLAGRIADMLGPWAVAGPALEVGTRALLDHAWADRTRRRLTAAAAGLDQILSHGGLDVLGGTSLFRLAGIRDAEVLFERLARAGIWVRRFPDQPDRLRFGLLPDDRAADRLQDALAGRP